MVQGSEAFQLSQKLKNLLKDLVEWNRIKYGSIGKRIKDIETEVASLQKDSNSIPTKEILRERSLIDDLEKLFHDEQILWAQRAHQLWLINGDRNTRYFHL